MKLPRSLASVLLVSALAIVGYAQVSAGVQANPPAPVPDYILWDVFFFRVAWLDQMAQEEEARGRDGSSIRSLIRRQAKLKPEEEQTLKAVAADCRTKVAEMLASTRATAMAGPKGGPQTAADQRKQLVLDHVAQLRSTLSRVAFLQLDTYVRLTVRVQMGRSRD